MGPGEDRKSDDVDVLLRRRGGDLLRGEANPLVHHLHPDVARAHRDLLGAIGVAVEARLADDELQTPAKLA